MSTQGVALLAISFAVALSATVACASAGKQPTPAGRGTEAGQAANVSGSPAADEAPPVSLGAASRPGSAEPPPAASAEPPSGETAPSIEVTVGPGDTLASLAEPHLLAGTELLEFVAAIAVLNGIEDLDRIEAGQVLRIPSVVPAPGVVAPSPTPRVAAPAPTVLATAVPPANTPTPMPPVTVIPTETTPQTPQLPQTPSGPAYFATLPPGSALPSGASCAEWVRRAPELHPENREANQRRVGATGVRIDGASDRFNGQYAERIDGGYAGTTDEIIQWAACKWGFDEDLTRARVYVESSWRHSTTGDETDDAERCRSVGLSAPCAQSYGLLQVKITVHEGTSPHALLSSAFNVDYALGWLRACYEGDFRWLGSDYGAGDLQGCVGAWFSGRWHDGGAQRYIERVQGALAERRWERPRS